MAINIKEIREKITEKVRRQTSVKEGLEYDKIHDFNDLQMAEIKAWAYR